MEDARVRILTPKCSVDVLRDVHAAKEQGRPYVITFVGVNGVGKSSNLAKIAYWLQRRNISVVMAACDTPRSGAVEQLQTHARKLQIPIFEKGYEKDHAVVAKEAIREAKSTDWNDAVDQLSKFNQKFLLYIFLSFSHKLADLSSSPSSRVIDGILLTKFDSPVMFVGCGQSYIDFRKLNVKPLSRLFSNRNRNLKNK
ncbi:hypothetical protein MKW98_005238 [Papaver atlanticum]|uniref:SRP54-type proteins GTP-binding domain-containing protein n=1 Tax=Papaver atlanticum TaxID=357466 RepID=A0AAD4RWF1_9MAGN|nr:hypothetical protein MKW98_005238 [Papaver atlanticum]